jgi:hypothetical protein
MIPCIRPYEIWGVNLSQYSGLPLLPASLTPEMSG